MKTVDERIWEDNLRMREEYVAVNSFAEIDDLEADQLELWKANKLIFWIYDEHGSELIPSFQFEDSKPMDIISSALKRFPADMTPWQIAFWFSTPNGYLDDEIPQECLRDIDGLLIAAEVEANRIFG